MRLLCVLFLVMLSGTNVQAHERVRIVTEPFPPYFSPALPHNGWLAHVVHEAFSLQDIDTSFDFTLWSRALKSSKKYQGVVLLGSYKTPSRVRSYLFSCEVAQTNTGLFRRRNTSADFTGDLTHLDKSIVVTGRGYAIDTKILKKLNTDILEVTSIQKALELLANGRVDWVLGAKEVTEFHIQQSSYANEVIFDAPTLEKNSLHLVLSREYEENEAILRHFHMGLTALVESGRIKEILALHGFDELQQQAYVQQLTSSIYKEAACDGLPE